MHRLEEELCTPLHALRPSTASFYEGLTGSGRHDSTGSDVTRPKSRQSVHGLLSSDLLGCQLASTHGTPVLRSLLFSPRPVDRVDADADDDGDVDTSHDPPPWKARYLILPTTTTTTYDLSLSSVPREADAESRTHHWVTLASVAAPASVAPPRATSRRTNENNNQLIRRREALRGTAGRRDRPRSGLVRITNCYSQLQLYYYYR